MTSHKQPLGYTPGPWSVERHPHLGRPMVEDEGGYVVADCCNGEIETAAEEANARLIAAAPDMFEALQWAVDHFEGRTRENAKQLSNCIDKCASAIARARGQ